jgi:hypothetical protein
MSDKQFPSTPAPERLNPSPDITRAVQFVRKQCQVWLWFGPPFRRLEQLVAARS